jgi:hypothetical protein
MKKELLATTILMIVPAAQAGMPLPNKAHFSRTKGRY